MSKIEINGVTYKEADVALAVECFVSSKETLSLCKRMIDEALPKFNWAKSALDANAIDLLNRASIAVPIALAKMTRAAKEEG